MSEKNWKLENNLCRCCHSEGAFKNLANPCLREGQEEIYCDMLQECLDIIVTPVPGPLCAITYTICEDCIMRLRDACSFKQQVAQCEERFHDLYNRDVIKISACYDGLPVKQEVEHEDVKIDISRIDEDVDFDLKYDEDEDGDKSEVRDIKEEERARPKKPKTKDKAKQRKNTGRPRKLKPEDADKTGKDDKKGVKAPAAPKFNLRDEDFTKEGDTYQCSRCEKRYDKFFSLRYHVKTKHYKIARYRCPYCEEEFMTPAPLAVHKLKEHNVDDRFKCNACKGVFNTKVQLRKHINNFHMLGERYKCEFCEYESFSFEGMYKHKFKHKTVKDYHCRFCRKAFLRKTTLDLHERIHTGDRRKVCSICSKAFVQKASLNYHMTKYHPEVNF